jgi:hypothetical protein
MIVGAVVVLLWLGASSPLLGQDDEQTERDGVGIFLEVNAWQAEPGGLEYEPATRDNGDVFGPEIVKFDQETKTEGYYRAGWDLGDEIGRFQASWYGQSQENELQELQAGSFVYGQTLSHPLLAGFENNGLADGFESAATTKLTDLRFNFGRTAFRSDHLVGRWFVGVRRVTHDRDLSATYFALSPVLPPLTPPRPDLDPIPDQARVSSSYVGRGMEGGMEFDVPLGGERFRFQAGFAMGVLAGKTDADYYSSNSFYVQTVDDETTVFAPPYDFETASDSVTQETDSILLQSISRSTTSPVLDLHLSLRARVWQGLEVLAGYRTTYYGNVGVDLRPKVASVTEGGTNLQDVTEVDRSADYSGFLFGVAYTF